MNHLILEWSEDQQTQRRSFAVAPVDPQTRLRIGRDPAQCDLVLRHPTVSKVHAEIWFDAQHHAFRLQNLRGDSNPPRVDQQVVRQTPVTLHLGSTLYLGQVELKVIDLRLSIAPTLLISPPLHLTPAPVAPAAAAAAPTSPANATHGLLCPRCHHISPLDHLTLGCPWCGTSLASANSVLMMPE